MGFWGALGSTAVKIGTAAADIALDATPLGSLINLETLIDSAETAFGSGHGQEKEQWVLSVVMPLFEALDKNDKVEFGVKSWVDLSNAIKLSIQAGVEIRKATTWFDKD